MIRVLQHLLYYQAIAVPPVAANRCLRVQGSQVWNGCRPRKLGLLLEGTPQLKSDFLRNIMMI